MLQSKKFWVMVTGLIALVASVLTGEITFLQAVMPAVGLIMAWLTAQGLADFGKNTVVK